MAEMGKTAAETLVIGQQFLNLCTQKMIELRKQVKSAGNYCMVFNCCYMLLPPKMTNHDVHLQ